MVKLLSLREIEMFDYEKIKLRVNNYLLYYKILKDKEEVIRKKMNSPLANDNMGIYSGTVNNPTYSKVEKLEAIQEKIRPIESIINSCKSELTKDELLCFNELILSGHTTEDLEEILNCSYGRVVSIKKSCYIKVSRWFDLEVYKDNILI